MQTLDILDLTFDALQKLLNDFKSLKKKEKNHAVFAKTFERFQIQQKTIRSEPLKEIEDFLEEFFKILNLVSHELNIEIDYDYSKKTFLFSLRNPASCSIDKENLSLLKVLILKSLNCFVQFFHDDDLLDIFYRQTADNSRLYYTILLMTFLEANENPSDLNRWVDVRKNIFPQLEVALSRNQEFYDLLKNLEKENGALKKVLTPFLKDHSPLDPATCLDLRNEKLLLFYQTWHNEDLVQEKKISLENYDNIFQDLEESLSYNKKRKKKILYWREQKDLISEFFWPLAFLWSIISQSQLIRQFLIGQLIEKSLNHLGDPRQKRKAGSILFPSFELSQDAKSSLDTQKKSLTFSGEDKIYLLVSNLDQDVPEQQSQELSLSGSFR